MVGKKFKCSQCDHARVAGITRLLKTDALPGARFYNICDSLGLWVKMDGALYCGPCSDKAFPQILADGVEFVRDGCICF
jgi:hypothetical protein